MILSLGRLYGVVACSTAADRDGKPASPAIGSSPPLSNVLRLSRCISSSLRAYLYQISSPLSSHHVLTVKSVLHIIHITLFEVGLIRERTPRAAWRGRGAQHRRSQPNRRQIRTIDHAPIQNLEWLATIRAVYDAARPYRCARRSGPRVSPTSAAERANRGIQGGGRRHLLRPRLHRHARKSSLRPFAPRGPDERKSADPSDSKWNVPEPELALA